jgi:hypothetical protein
MFRSSLENQFVNKVPEVKEANQMRIVYKLVCESHYELRNKLPNFATKFGTFVVKIL